MENYCKEQLLMLRGDEVCHDELPQSLLLRALLDPSWTLPQSINKSSPLSQGTIQQNIFKNNTKLQSCSKSRTSNEERLHEVPNECETEKLLPSVAIDDDDDDWYHPSPNFDDFWDDSPPSEEDFDSLVPAENRNFNGIIKSTDGNNERKRKVFEQSCSWPGIIKSSNVRQFYSKSISQPEERANVEEHKINCYENPTQDRQINYLQKYTFPIEYISNFSNGNTLLLDSSGKTQDRIDLQYSNDIHANEELPALQEEINVKSICNAAVINYNDADEHQVENDTTITETEKKQNNELSPNYNIYESNRNTSQMNEITVCPLTSDYNYSLEDGMINTLQDIGNKSPYSDGNITMNSQVKLNHSSTSNICNLSNETIGIEKHLELHTSKPSIISHLPNEDEHTTDSKTKFNNASSENQCEVSDPSMNTEERLEVPSSITSVISNLSFENKNSTMNSNIKLNNSGTGNNIEILLQSIISNLAYEDEHESDSKAKFDNASTENQCNVEKQAMHTVERLELPNPIPTIISNLSFESKNSPMNSNTQLNNPCDEHNIEIPIPFIISNLSCEDKNTIKDSNLQINKTHSDKCILINQPINSEECLDPDIPTSTSIYSNTINTTFTKLPYSQDKQNSDTLLFKKLDEEINTNHENGTSQNITFLESTTYLNSQVTDSVLQSSTKITTPMNNMNETFNNNDANSDQYESNSADIKQNSDTMLFKKLDKEINTNHEIGTSQDITFLESTTYLNSQVTESVPQSSTKITTPMNTTNETFNNNDDNSDQYESNSGDIKQNITSENILNLEIENAIYKYENEISNDVEVTQNVAETTSRQDAVVQTDICNLLNIVHLCTCIEYFTQHNDSSSINVNNISSDEIESRVAQKRSLQALNLEPSCHNKKVRSIQQPNGQNILPTVSNIEIDILGHSGVDSDMEDDVITADKLDKRDMLAAEFGNDQQLCSSEILEIHAEKNSSNADQQVPEVTSLDENSNKLLTTQLRGFGNFCWKVQHDSTNQVDADEDREDMLSNQCQELPVYPKRSLRVGLSRRANPRKLHSSSNN